MSNPSMWDVGTGAGGRSYLMRFDEATNAWGAVTVQARLTVETNPVTKERGPAEIGNVQVSQPQPDPGLQVLRSVVAPDRMSVEVVVGASAQTDPAPGAHTFVIRLGPAASPFDIGAAAATAAGGFGGVAVAAGTRVPTADVQFVVAVDPASRFVIDPKSAISLNSATGDPVHFSATMEVRANGQWTPQPGQAVSATPEPEGGGLCWSLQTTPPPASGGIAADLRATRFVVGSGDPLSVGTLRVHTTMQSSTSPPDSNIAVSVTTHPVTCSMKVVRTATNRVLAERPAQMLSGDIVAVTLSSSDTNLQWEGLELRIDLTNPPAGYGRSHHASVTTPVNAAGTVTVDLRQSSFQDRHGRTCDVSLPLEDSAPGVWRLEIGKSGWAPSGVIELGQKIGFETLQELNQKGGTLRVYGLGKLESSHGALTHTLQHFEGMLQVRLPEEPVKGRPENDQDEADCLVFDIRPAGAGSTDAAGGTGTAPAGGAKVDYTADMRIHPEIEKHLLRTDRAASALGESLSGAAKGYLEYCLEYLAVTTSDRLKDDNIFERRLKRVPIFLEGTNNITVRAERAVDVRSAVMKRITANMLDFLIEIAFIGLGFAADFWKGGKAAAREAAEETAQSALKGHLWQLGEELDTQAARLGREADDLVKAVDRAAEQGRAAVDTIATRFTEMDRLAAESARLTSEIAELERAIAKASQTAKPAEAALARLQAEISTKSARRKLGVERVQAKATEMTRLYDSVISPAKGQLEELCGKAAHAREARTFAEQAVTNMKALNSAAEAEFEQSLEAVMKPFAERARHVQDVREQVYQQARAMFRSSTDLELLRETRAQLARVAATYADDAGVREALTQTLHNADATIVELEARAEVAGAFKQELGMKLPAKGVFDKFVEVSREERQAYEHQQGVSAPAEPNTVSPETNALLHPVDPSSPFYTPTTGMASDTATLAPGSTWKLLNYVWQTVGYYGGAFVQYTAEGFAKIVEYGDYLGLDKYASNLDEPTRTAGLGYLDQQFGHARGQLTFSRDTADRIKTRLDRVRPENQTRGADPSQALRASWGQEDDGDATRHKQALRAFAVTLCTDALEPSHFAEEPIAGEEAERAHQNLVRVTKRLAAWLKEYELATQVDKENHSFIEQLRAVNKRRSASTWTWADIDHHIDWWAWFVAWSLRVGAVAGIVLLPGAGTLAAAAAVGAADVVDVCSAGLRVVISGMGGLRDANAFVQDFAIVNGYFHALWVGPQDSDIGAQLNPSTGTIEVFG
jgi:hypothetical protein